MTILSSRVSTSDDEFRLNREAYEAVIANLQSRRQLALAGGPLKAREKHLARNKILPRHRVEVLLDPGSRLFLSATGEGFKITPYGKEGQMRFLCRPILETYSKLFRYSELQGVTALSVRRTVISRLYERGADEGQVGLLLGISERSAVRELLSRHKPTIAVLVDELI